MISSTWVVIVIAALLVGLLVILFTGSKKHSIHEGHGGGGGHFGGVTRGGVRGFSYQGHPRWNRWAGGWAGWNSRWPWWYGMFPYDWPWASYVVGQDWIDHTTGKICKSPASIEDLYDCFGEAIDQDNDIRPVGF